MSNTRLLSILILVTILSSLVAAQDGGITDPQDTDSGIDVIGGTDNFIFWDIETAGDLGIFVAILAGLTALFMLATRPIFQLFTDKFPTEDVRNQTNVGKLSLAFSLAAGFVSTQYAGLILPYYWLLILAILLLLILALFLLAGGRLISDGSGDFLSGAWQDARDAMRRLRTAGDEISDIRRRQDSERTESPSEAYQDAATDLDEEADALRQLEIAERDLEDMIGNLEEEGEDLAGRLKGEIQDLRKYYSEEERLKKEMRKINNLLRDWDDEHIKKDERIKEQLGEERGDISGWHLVSNQQPGSGPLNFRGSQLGKLENFLKYEDNNFLKKLEGLIGEIDHEKALRLLTSSNQEKLLEEELREIRKFTQACEEYHELLRDLKEEIRELEAEQEFTYEEEMEFGDQRKEAIAKELLKETIEAEGPLERLDQEEDQINEELGTLINELEEIEKEELYIEEDIEKIRELSNYQREILNPVFKYLRRGAKTPDQSFKDNFGKTPGAYYDEFKQHKEFLRKLNRSGAQHERAIEQLVSDIEDVEELIRDTIREIGS